MAGPAVGLNTAFGIAQESTYGTPVVVSRFYEILSESLERRNRTLVSNGLRAQTRNLRRGTRRVISGRDAGGDVTMEVPTTTAGIWFKNILGGTPTVVQQGASAAYLHTYAMGSLEGLSLTAQKSLRDAGGTEVETFTYHGAKVTAAEFSISVDQILQMAVSLDCEDVDTSTAAAAASYTANKLFHFAQGELRVDGSAVASVTGATARVENALKTDRYYIGSDGLKKEPTDNDFPTVGGSLTAEFLSPATFYDRFAADNGAALVLEFVGDNIASTYDEMLRITVPDVRFTGGTPTVGGADVISQTVPYEGTSIGSTAGVTIEYQTTDTAV